MPRLEAYGFRQALGLRENIYDESRADAYLESRADFEAMPVKL